MKKNILFVCIENSNRSQMAQAFAVIHGGDIVNAYSAGSKPSGFISPKAIALMGEIGYDLSTHTSKGLDTIPDVVYDYVVTMGCGDACPFVAANHRENWDIPDPREMNVPDIRQLRNEIEKKVISLLTTLR